MWNRTIVRVLLGLALGLVQATDARAAPLRAQGSGYELQVLVGGAPVRTFYHEGQSLALGQHGDRYTLRVVNHTGRRVEAVVTVDGRDVVDGRGGDVHKRGYLVQPWGQIDIDGWRVSSGQVAAFRFSSVSGSYAARTGSARDVGVIGVAVFPERQLYVPPLPPPLYRPMPHRHADGGDLGGDEYQAPSGAAGPGASAAASPAPQAQDKAAGGVLSERRRMEEPARAERRPGLGTGFGESVDSPVQEVSFVRADPGRPSAVIGLRYNDHDGLVAMGVDVDGEYPPWGDAQVRRSADPFPAQRGYASPPPGWVGR